ncbi:MAG: TetR/AcrR family transcriptional regulator [Polyangiaceae bacterium]
MGRPRSISDEAVLDAAREVFLAEGAGASVLAVARRAGISHAAIHQRFGSKEDLLLAALGPTARLVMPKGLARPPDARPAREQLRAIARDLAAVFDAYVPGISVLAAAGISPQRAYGAGGQSPPLLAQRALARWLRAADAAALLRCPNPDATAIAMIGAFHGRAFLESTGAADAKGLHPDSILDAFWEGLRP